eukprot:2332761-Amphidinium_carterae.1
MVHASRATAKSANRSADCTAAMCIALPATLRNCDKEILPSAKHASAVGTERMPMPCIKNNSLGNTGRHALSPAPTHS